MSDVGVDPFPPRARVKLACTCLLAMIAVLVPFRSVASAIPTKTHVPRAAPALAPVKAPRLSGLHPLDSRGMRRASLSPRARPLVPGLLGPGVAQPSSIHPVHGVLSRGVRDDLYSTNWSGQVLLGGSYTAVGADWTVPAVVASGSPEYSATWIGIDGTTSTTLVQTGTAQETAGGITDYYAWVELLPGAEMPIVDESDVPAPVVPGDQIQAAVEETSINVWTIFIQDLTQSWTFSQPFDYTSPGASAEWIEEAPSVGGAQSTLADFGSTTFTSLDFSGTTPSSSVLEPVFMLNPSETEIIAYPGGFDSGTDSFTDYFGAPVPVVTSVSPTKGSTEGGTNVTVGGDFLIGATAVDFGSTERDLYAEQQRNHCRRCTGREQGNRRRDGDDPGRDQHGVRRGPIHLCSATSGHHDDLAAAGDGRRGLYGRARRGERHPRVHLVDHLRLATGLAESRSGDRGDQRYTDNFGHIPGDLRGHRRQRSDRLGGARHHRLRRPGGLCPARAASVSVTPERGTPRT